MLNFHNNLIKQTAAIDFRQTSYYSDFMIRLGWKVVRIDQLFASGKRCVAYLWPIPLCGLSYLSLQRVDADINLKILSRFCGEYHVGLARIDFNLCEKEGNQKTMLATQLFREGFHSVPWCSAPTKTLIIRLDQPIQNIWSAMHAKTRYNIRLAEKRGVIVEFYTKTSIKEYHVTQFLKILNENNAQKSLPNFSNKMATALFQSFGDRAFLALAFVKNCIVAGALFLSNGKTTVSYTQNCSDQLGKHYFSPSLIIWDAIKRSKKSGFVSFDFEGVYDDRNPVLTETWKGFTRFKESFGGNHVFYTLPYENIYVRNKNISQKLAYLWIKSYLNTHALPSIYPSFISFS